MKSLKEEIRKELNNPDFPNLKFLYSAEVLDIAPELLRELLEEEKKEFQEKLLLKNDVITFESFDEFSLLGYFFSILEHYQGVHSDDVIRKIIEDFEPEYIDFWNEVAYSKRYFEMLKIARETKNLNLEQIKILDESIESYEVRWIALADSDQDILKELNKNLSELSQKFSNNALDSQKEFEYIITDESIISQMPEDDKSVAKKKYDEKYSIHKAQSEEEFKACFEFFQIMWDHEFNITLWKNKYEKFSRSEIFYIGWDELIGAIQIESIDEKIIENDDKELKWVAKIWEKLLGRIWVLKEYRWKSLGSTLIEFVQQKYAKEWETKMYIPAAEQNETYYNTFWFQRFSDPVDCWNTKKLMMVAPLSKDISQKQWYLFDASQSSYGSVMKYCSESSVRKYFYESRNSFATTGKYNNNPLILEILKLREQKAKLLGFKNYAELSLHFKMADSSKQIISLFWDIASQARPKAEAELQEIKDYFQLKNLDIWDLGYYANKLKQEKYAFDSRELKKYFVYENVLAWMFETTGRLYGIEMKKTTFESYSPEVQIYEVSRNGKFISYFFTDYFYTPLKRQGAWADLMREKFWDYKKIVLNTCNFQKGSDGVTLLTLGDVETMYHEFGHAIHEMLSVSEYSELSGFHVEHDFVELPSQLLENWARDEVGMKLFARHFENGSEIPSEMLQKLKILEMFGNAQMILAQNTYAMLDMSLHSQNIPTNEAELDALVRENALQNSIFPVSKSYSPHTTFTHIFDGGYAAGYYSYMWAEIIEKEVWQAFKNAWDIFSPEIASRFHDLMLSAGSTKKASELFQDFFARDVNIDAFLKEKGLL